MILPDEFTDDHILSNGTILPIPGSNGDFAYDQDEYEDYAKMIGYACVEVRWA